MTKALITLAVDVDTEGYEREYGVTSPDQEILDYVKDLIKESGEIRLNQVGAWARITKVDVTPPVDGPPGRTWEDVFEQARAVNASDHMGRMVAITIPSPFLEAAGTYVLAYVDRETRIH